MAKTKKKATGRAKRNRTRGQQTYIEGMEPKKNNAIHGIAIDYADVRDERMALNKKEEELKNRLIDAMTAEGVIEYEYDDVHVDLKSVLEVKVRKVKAAA